MENLAAANVVVAGLYGATIHEVDSPIERRAELVLHSDQIEKRPSRLGAEGDQQIDIARRSEVVAEGTTEQFEPLDVPLAAQVGDPLLVDNKFRAHVSASIADCRTPADPLPHR